ncbi:tripartite tricarboxylate transporter TctB family protein [Bacillus oleivorans]|uniref:Tripartite tricarboxylate transporter TctB family protein n=1 Tax=Bacillus oleivorans TaxID=1448271 RepID=A0A285D7P6_9BACI|nr:tripartite tricarboxylate transporter TctB family protein [Bacillus oleivorans]SNX75203.1 tripartite tricarboxylate transporter TctB family protein [Bacillus oleivorans]
MQAGQRVVHDVVSSVILIIIAVIALWETRGLTEMSYVFPRTVGAILLVLSIAYFILSLKKREEKKLFQDLDGKKVMVMSLSMIGYCILIGLVGFFAASLLYIGYISWWLQKGEEEKSNKRKLIHASLASVVVTVSFFILFQYIFLVPLPIGVLFGG